MTLREYIQDLSLYLESAVNHYERTAPVVAEWLNDLYIRISEDPDSVTLSELNTAEYLGQDEWLDANHAANRVYHLLERLGRDTTGMAGF